MGLAVELVIVLALIIFNGALAMAEMALVSSRRIRLQQAAERGNAGAQRALELASEPNRFLSTVQIGITLVGLVAGAFGGANIAVRLERPLQDLGLNASLANTLSYGVVLVTILYLSLVLGELVPKRIALLSPERIASTMTSPMLVLSRVAGPFVTILSTSTAVVLRVLGMHGNQDFDITEEEIRLQIARSVETGSVEEAEAQLLDRVFHFGDRRLHEVMVPRTEVVWLRHDDTVRDFYRVYAEHTHSRFPVYEDGPDSVVGVVGIKDVLKGVATGAMSPDTPVRHVMRKAYFVPEAKLVGELFREMQSSRIQMAVAVDEFGGTAGIVTLEQLLEEMVGSVADELRPHEEEITLIDERTFDVDGALSTEEARDELGIDLPEGDYDTIAGFVLSQLGRIPEEGEAITLDGWRIVVVQMKGPKVELLRVTRAL